MNRRAGRNTREKDGGAHELERKGWDEEYESSEITMRATENRTGNKVNDWSFESILSR